MAERLDLPPTPYGEPEQQLEQMYRYLYQLAEDINRNFEQIGDNNLTDAELTAMKPILQASRNEAGPDMYSSMNAAETLKSLIIKTADWVQTQIDQYRLSLEGMSSAESVLGRVVRNTRMDMVVTPEGDTRQFALHEIITGVSTYEVNSKNYIKSGLLYYDGLLPVYGVAVGKDVVTFAQDGTETYNDGNKVAMFTDDELSFYQNGAKVASYTGTELSFYQNGAKMISVSASGVSFYQGEQQTAFLSKDRLGFYSNGSEIMYLAGGKIYCSQDLNIASGKKLIIDSANFKMDSSGNVTLTGKVTATDGAIGGWTIGTKRLSSGSGSSYVGLDSGTSGVDYAIWAGNGTASSAPFSVTRAGAVKATSGSIGGWTLGASRLSSGAGNTYIAMDSGTSGEDCFLWAGNSSSGSAPFSVGKDGTLVASSGTVGGWTLGANRLSSGSGNTYIAMDNGSGEDCFLWAGNSSSGSAPFSVGKDGTLVASSGTVGGWTMGAKRLSSGSGSSYVALDSGTSGVTYAIWAGNGTASDAPFSVTRAGGIKATSGTVGGWTLGGNRLSSGSGSNFVALDSGTSGVDYAIWAGNGTASSAPFSVTRAGAMKATSGTIGGWSIGANEIYSNSVHIRNNLPNDTRVFEAGQNFYVTRDGYLYAMGTNMSLFAGTPAIPEQQIPATDGYVRTNLQSASAGSSASGTCICDGTVGGWTLGTDKFYSTSYKTGLCKSTTTGDVVIWAGNTSGSGGNASIKSSATFYVLAEGEMHATGAVISGTITATSGTFGNGSSNLTVGTSQGYGAIWSGRTSIGDNNHEGIYVGANGINVGMYSASKGRYITNFAVDTQSETLQAGILRLTSAYIFIGSPPSGSYIPCQFLADQDGNVYATKMYIWNGSTWAKIDPAKAC